MNYVFPFFRRAVAVVLAACGVLAVAYVTLLGVASWRQGYSWAEMDWHGRGSTSVADFFAASGIGKRVSAEGGKTCVEYYAYKDGLAVKRVCPK